MKIEIELKRGTARRIAVVGATLIILGIGAAVYANQIHFTSGQTLTAAQLDNNFDELYAAAAKPSITRNGKSISIGGAYCGATSATYDGAAIGGYTGAKAKCEATCGTATAHMCDGADILRSEQLGITMPDGVWLSSYTASITAVDCLMWTKNTTNTIGEVLNLSPPLFLTAACNTSHSIACCD